MSEHKFKAGDRVRCIQAGGYPKINTDEVFIVSEYDSLQDGEWLLKLEGRYGTVYYERRFELVEAAQPQEFRLLSTSGSVNNVHKFATVEEAKEHARKNFNDDTVFEVVEVVSAGKFKVTHAVEAA
ncbi:hypothetical protein ACI2US_03070 [Ralstonia nicotianae]